jgi:hypothetical protein
LKKLNCFYFMHVISQIVETKNDGKEPDVRQWSRTVVIEVHL